MICSYPRSANSMVFPELYRRGEIELELVPQGTLVERIRAGAPASRRSTPRRPWALCSRRARNRASSTAGNISWRLGLRADFALVRAERADRYGNLVYNHTARNFGPIMCTASDTTIVQVREMVELGEIDPECVVTPGSLRRPGRGSAHAAQESALVREGRCYP